MAGFQVNKLVSDIEAGTKAQNTVIFGADGKVVSEVNPQPSRLYGEDAEGNIVPIKVDDEGKVLTSTQVTGSYEEYRILSTDTFPVAKADEKGAQLILMDTGVIYFNHGSQWVVF